jgi:Spy/CpxP family protein refolding chaperone
MKRTLVIVAIFLMATAAFAQNGPRPGSGPGGAAPQAGAPQGPRPGGPGPAGEILSPPQLAAFLGLTDSQKSALQAAQETLQNTVKPLVEQERANGEALKAAVEAGDAAKAGQLLVANYAIGQQIKAAHDAFRAAFESQLTSEQKAKLAIYQQIVELSHQHPAPPQD